MRAYNCPLADLVLIFLCGSSHTNNLLILKLMSFILALIIPSYNFGNRSLENFLHRTGKHFVARQGLVAVKTTVTTDGGKKGKEVQSRKQRMVLMAFGE